LENPHEITSVACHPTQVNAPFLKPMQPDAPQRRKAELSLVMVIFEKRND